jgi:hypothetical protein
MKVVGAYLINKGMTHALTTGVEGVSRRSGRGLVLGDFRRTSCHLPAGDARLSGNMWKIAPYRWKRPGMQGVGASLRASSQNHSCSFQAALFHPAVLGLSACGEMVVEIHTAKPAIRLGNYRQGLPQGQLSEDTKRQGF